MSVLFGKYRGKVENNLDPHGQGRVQVTVPTVLGDSLQWAMPCTPYAGSGVGFFAIPPVGANVWVEFEGGDQDRAIWVGCFWDEGDAPADPALAEKKVLKTDVGTITLDDTAGAGGITIETSGGQKIVMSSTGIEVSAGQGTIKINGTQVSVNDGALEVT